MKNPFLVAVGLVVVLFVIGEIPAVQKDFLIPATLDSPHLVVLAEAIVGVIVTWIASRSKEITVKHEDVKAGTRL